MGELLFALKVALRRPRRCLGVGPTFRLLLSARRWCGASGSLLGSAMLFAVSRLVIVVTWVLLLGQCVQQVCAPVVTCGNARVQMLVVSVGIRGTLLYAKSVVTFRGQKSRQASARKLLQSRLSAA